MTGSIRLRKDLASGLPLPVWPAGTGLVGLSTTAPRALHAILADVYATGFGSVPAFDDWWAGLTRDDAFDPALFFVACGEAQAPIGLAQCWTSGFIKDIAVSAGWRRRGIGEALLFSAFHAFHERGATHVDLKLVPGNMAALRLYHRVGMVTVPD